MSFDQRASSAKPGPVGGSQPQTGVSGTGRGPRLCRAWKRGSLELNLAVLHFPREQDEERQFLCWASCMINGEFKHSIGLLCNLAVLLIFSGKVCFSPKKRVAGFFQQWLHAGSSHVVGSLCVWVCKIKSVLFLIFFFRSHLILKFDRVRNTLFWCVLFVYKYSVFFSCSYAFESVDSYQYYKEKSPKCMVV